jgi:hypothetical protein
MKSYSLGRDLVFSPDDMWRNGPFLDEISGVILRSSLVICLSVSHIIPELFRSVGWHLSHPSESKVVDGSSAGPDKTLSSFCFCFTQNTGMKRDLESSNWPVESSPVKMAREQRKQ